MIKVIFFDWGYVFTQGFKKRDKKLDKVLRSCGLTWKKFLPLWREFYTLRSAGKIKNDKELEILIKRVVQKDIPVRKIIEITIKSTIIPKKHIKIIRKLKKNYKVGILSNNVWGWINKILENYKIKNLFDGLIVSSKVGARKPDAIIYYEALRKFSAKPEETIFIADEVSEDLVPATGLGMKTIWFKTRYKGWWRKNDEKVLKVYRPDATVRTLGEVISVIGNLK